MKWNTESYTSLWPAEEKQKQTNKKTPPKSRCTVRKLPEKKATENYLPFESIRFSMSTITQLTFCKSRFMFCQSKHDEGIAELSRHLLHCWGCDEKLVLLLLYGPTHAAFGSCYMSMQTCPLCHFIKTRP